MAVKRRIAAGFSLVEILVTLLIALTAIMGVVSLVARTTQQEMESYQRVQALTLMQDMVDRVNANRQVAACYSNGANGLTLGTGVADSDIPDCTLGTANQQTRAEVDLQAWNRQLKGAAEQDSGGGDLGAMIGARGCIVQVDPAERIYRISVAWQGMGETVVPDDPCAQGLYGADDSLRRVISAIVRVGDLT